MNIGDSEEFNNWNKIKTKINSFKDNIKFKERDVYWVNLGKNVGWEQDGKNENFTRPVLIVKKFGEKLFWGMPLSSKIKDNKFYYSFKKDDNQYSVIILQLKTLSSRRLRKRLFRINKKDFSNIMRILRDIIPE